LRAGGLSPTRDPSPVANQSLLTQRMAAARLLFAAFSIFDPPMVAFFTAW
jgi:hypothetical protein